MACCGSYAAGFTLLWLNPLFTCPATHVFSRTPARSASPREAADRSATGRCSTAVRSAPARTRLATARRTSARPALGSRPQRAAPVRRSCEPTEVTVSVQKTKPAGKTDLGQVPVPTGAAKPAEEAEQDRPHFHRQ